MSTIARSLPPPTICCQDVQPFRIARRVNICRQYDYGSSGGRGRSSSTKYNADRISSLFCVFSPTEGRCRPARFLILGSATPDLLGQSAESLAGRLETIALSPFGLEELGPDAVQRHWRRGGFPQSYLARSEKDSFIWREQFIRTVLERDPPQLGIRIPSTALFRFWTMLAHYHGSVWNAAEPARSLGLSQPTVRRYLDLLSGLYMVRQLPSWHESLKKRQVKASKIYLQDSGLLHALLGIRTDREILSHPKVGASWEGYVIEEILKTVRPDASYFWATHTGAELDLLLFKAGRRYGVEIKFQDAPRLTPSMRIAMEDLGLEGLTVLYPGDLRYELAERVTVVPLAEIVGGTFDVLTSAPKKRGGAGR
jgi:predicted AAA+ superfamily ATPase